jgi:putative transposase
MAAAYSMDLRARVIKDADAGIPSKALAARYHVSVAWVDALKLRWRTTGSIAPRKQTKFRTRVLAGHVDHLRAVVTAQPDRTLREIQASLHAPASLTTIWRELHALRLTLKKNRTR